MPTYWTFLAMLVPTGFAALTFMTSANATMQLGVSSAMRGRVMALYMTVFFGGTPLGAPLLGWVAESFGPRWSLVVGGSVSLAAAVVVGMLLARRRDSSSVRMYFRDLMCRVAGLTPGPVTRGWGIRSAA